MATTLDDLLHRADHAANTHDIDLLRTLVNEARAIQPSLANVDAVRVDAECARWEGIRSAIMGDLPAALASFEQALSHFMAIEHESGISRAMGNIALIHSDMGDYSTALTWYHRALERSEQQGDEATMAIVLGNIGVTHSRSGAQNEALTWYHRSLEIHQRRGDAASAARLMGNIGVIYGRIADFTAALQWLFEALATHESMGNRRNSAIVMGSIGHVYTVMGDYATSIDWYMKALVIEEEMGNTHGIAVTTGNIGSVYGDVGDAREALVWLRRAHEMHVTSGNKHSAAHARGNIAEALIELGELDAADRELRDVITISDELGQRSLNVRARNTLARLLLRRSSIDEARMLIDGISHLVWEEPLPSIAAHQNRSTLASIDGDVTLAERELVRALEIARQHGIRREEALIHKALRDLCRRQSRLAESIEHADAFEAINDELLGEQQRRRVDLLVVEHTMANERQRAERQRALLYNLLPESIAHRILNGETDVADDFDDAGVLFIDVANFTRTAHGKRTSEVLTMLNDLFTRFDTIAEEHGITKVKTIGDAWLGVSNAPTTLPQHHHALALAACSMLASSRSVGVDVRLGLHSGPISAGVIGTSRRTWDVWGDTVNVASRMESTSDVGRIHVSDAFAHALANDLRTQPTSTSLRIVSRGEVQVKGKGTMTTHWLEHIKEAG
ncbi:MAG: tetratricopeptide repeat protein [Bacteroidetes bacterium]|nr:tetratricopeptide repeat protein [Bacteroidota bacterium]